MFTIDLLKGTGIPEKSSPEKAVVSAVTIAVPVLVAIVLLGLYLSNRVAISVLGREAASYQKKAEDISNKLVTQKFYDTEKQQIKNYISETAEAINRHSQWSEILVTFIQFMPDSLVLTRLAAEQRNEKIKVPNKNKLGEKIDVMVPARTLVMSLGAVSDKNVDEDVREFRDKLRYSDLLSSKLDDIVVSQKVDTTGSREVISYEIKCIFKPQI
jgi:hypothetical protein